jgi:hypothetical protein
MAAMRRTVLGVVAWGFPLYAHGMSTHSPQYKYLAPKPGSFYKQLFIKDRWIFARTLYGQYVRDEEPLTPEQIAADWDLPLAAVQEAITYCESDPPEIERDYAREEALMEASGMNDPNYDGRPKVLSPQERARIWNL